jgi:signal transduction histidine kinase
MGSDVVTAFRFRILTRDGEVRWLGHACQPVYNKAGEFLGRRASNRDITEQVQAEEQREQYARDLESRNAELDAFAHTVAHDLKSPLTSLVGFSQLLGGRFGRMSPEQIAEGLGYIEQNSRKMVNIVDELLLLASVRQLEEVDIAPLDMTRIVAEARMRLDNMFTEHQAEIVIPGEWPEVVGYAPWLEEVWVNYISNAIKYGGRPDEGIPSRIELGFDTLTSAQSAEQGPESLQISNSSYIRFWVKDNGIGLSKEESMQLFTQFTRLHTLRAKGHGLGLSIVRRIVEKLGGNVGVESEFGVGSTFWFTLPATVPPCN